MAIQLRLFGTLPPACPTLALFAMQLGFESGSGFLIRRLGEGRWSAPLFVSATAMRAGAIAGVEKVRRSGCRQPLLQAWGLAFVLLVAMGQHQRMGDLPPHQTARLHARSPILPSHRP